MLNPVPESVCLEKSSTPFLSTSQFQNCLCKPADPTAVGQHSCQLMKTTSDLITLHKVAVNFLRLQLQLWTEGTKYCS
jgi:hypothetical protein